MMMMIMIMITGWQNCHRKWMLTIRDTSGFKKLTCLHLWHTAFFEGWSNAWDESIVLCEAHQRLREVYAGGTQFHDVPWSWTMLDPCLVKISGLLQIEILCDDWDSYICVAKNNQMCDTQFRKLYCLNSQVLLVILFYINTLLVEVPSFPFVVIEIHFLFLIWCLESQFCCSGFYFLKLSFGCFPNLCWDKLLYWLQWLAST